MSILPTPPGASRPARPQRGPARAAGAGDPGDDHPDRRAHRRPPRVVARRRRADDRAPPPARVAARPDRLGHGPPGLSAQAADRPPRGVRHAPPARWGGRLPAPIRIGPRRVRRRTCRHRAVDRRGPGGGARPAPRPRADRGRRRRRGPDERAVARGAQRHRPPPDPDADRRQRQRDVDQPDGRRVLQVPRRRSSCPAPGAQGKSAYDRNVERIPIIGGTVLELSKRVRRMVVQFAQPGQLFEDLGITYIGAVPGHDLHALLATLARALELPGPTIVHVRTQKGRGFRPAETDQVGFHGAALPPMTMTPGVDAYNGTKTALPHGVDVGRRRAARPDRRARRPSRRTTPRSSPSELIELARHDRRIVAITAGMPTGTGMARFQAELPGPVLRRRDRRAALRDAGDRSGHGRHAPGRRALLDVPPARLRPDRPRRLPERPAGADRGGPGRDWSARTGPATRGCSP